MFEDLTPNDVAEICAFSLMEHLGELDEAILNEWESVLHNLHWCTAIIAADGFDGLFFEAPTDTHILKILAALEQFHAPKCVGVYKRALSVFPSRDAIKDARRRKAIRKSLTPRARTRLTKLSREFSAANDVEINDKSILVFINSNRAQIRFDVILDQKRKAFRLICHDKRMKLKKR